MKMLFSGRSTNLQASFLRNDFISAAIAWNHSSASQPETDSLNGIPALFQSGLSPVTLPIWHCFLAFLVYLSVFSRLSLNNFGLLHIHSTYLQVPQSSMIESVVVMDLVRLQLRAGHTYFSSVHVIELSWSRLERNLHTPYWIRFNVLPRIWHHAKFLFLLLSHTLCTFGFSGYSRTVALIVRFWNFLQNKYFTIKFYKMTYIWRFSRPNFKLHCSVKAVCRATISNIICRWHCFWWERGWLA